MFIYKKEAKKTKKTNVEKETSIEEEYQKIIRKCIFTIIICVVAIILILIQIFSTDQDLPLDSSELTVSEEIFALQTQLEYNQENINELYQLYDELHEMYLIQGQLIYEIKLRANLFLFDEIEDGLRLD